jgi:hypothetical protein
MTDFPNLDPRLYELAGERVMEMPEAEHLPDALLETLRRRLAKAVQQSMEQEVTALRKELSA